MDLPALQDIERAAGAGFRELGMDAVADDEPPSLVALRGFVDHAMAWVLQADGRPVGYLLAEWVDGLAHVEQVSVHPSAGRRGFGRSLLEEVARWARERGVPALTLTTFADVPWNAPYYRRCGFRDLASGELTPGLRAIRTREAALGLDRWPRVCMRRDL